MDNSLLSLLRETGFTEKEASVYLALTELGRGDVTDIAKRSGLKRSIIYVLLDGLIEKGYVSRIPEARVSTYQATDPGLILDRINGTARNLFEMLPYLRSLKEKSGRRPRIHFIDTLEGIWKIYEEMNRCENQIFVSSYSKIDKAFPNSVHRWIDDFKKGRIGFSARHLIPDNPEDLAYARELSEIRQSIRIIPDTREISMDLAVFGNKLAITSFEEPPYLVLIESESLARSIMPIFEAAWQSAKEIGTGSNCD